MGETGDKDEKKENEEEKAEAEEKKEKTMVHSSSAMSNRTEDSDETPFSLDLDEKMKLLEEETHILETAEVVLPKPAPTSPAVPPKPRGLSVSKSQPNAPKDGAVVQAVSFDNSPLPAYSSNVTKFAITKSSSTATSPLLSAKTEEKDKKKNKKPGFFSKKGKDGSKKKNEEYNSGISAPVLLPEVSAQALARLMAAAEEQKRKDALELEKKREEEKKRDEERIRMEEKKIQEEKEKEESKKREEEVKRLEEEKKNLEEELKKVKEKGLADQKEEEIRIIQEKLKEEHEKEIALLKEQTERELEAKLREKNEEANRKMREDFERKEKELKERELQLLEKENEAKRKEEEKEEKRKKEEEERLQEEERKKREEEEKKIEEERMREEEKRMKEEEHAIREESFENVAIEKMATAMTEMLGEVEKAIDIFGRDLVRMVETNNVPGLLTFTRAVHFMKKMVMGETEGLPLFTPSRTDLDIIYSPTGSTPKPNDSDELQTKVNRIYQAIVGSINEIEQELAYIVGDAIEEAHSNSSLEVSLNNMAEVIRLLKDYLKVLTAFQKPITLDSMVEQDASSKNFARMKQQIAGLWKDLFELLKSPIVSQISSLEEAFWVISILKHIKLALAASPNEVESFRVNKFHARPIPDLFGSSDRDKVRSLTNVIEMVQTEIKNDIGRIYSVAMSSQDIQIVEIHCNSLSVVKQVLNVAIETPIDSNVDNYPSPVSPLRSTVSEESNKKVNHPLVGTTSLGSLPSNMQPNMTIQIPTSNNNNFSTSPRSPTSGVDIPVERLKRLRTVTLEATDIIEEELADLKQSLEEAGSVEDVVFYTQIVRNLQRLLSEPTISASTLVAKRQTNYTALSPENAPKVNALRNLTNDIFEEIHSFIGKIKDVTINSNLIDELTENAQFLRQIKTVLELNQ
eukprot:TRINITY_DN7333_c0_g1_i1.p1 TRINITY_DN7333_c0_g1~~TRINITY_DN7333_c0_g1_i1.p1  ORF type:complete len:915 (-),score=416.76 TRINITY_DN7333_c0_g1_i1:126-2870(-)